MTVFDWVFLGLVAASVLLGAWRGLVGEMLAVLGWIFACVVAWWGAGHLVPVFIGLVPASWMAWVLAFMGLVVLVLLLLALLRWLLRALLRASGLSATDRLCGALFGVLRALLIAWILVALAGLTSLPRNPWWREAIFAPPLETLVIAAKPWFPKELAVRIRYR